MGKTTFYNSEFHFKLTILYCLWILLHPYHHHHHILSLDYKLKFNIWLHVQTKDTTHFDLWVFIINVDIQHVWRCCSVFLFFFETAESTLRILTRKWHYMNILVMDLNKINWTALNWTIFGWTCMSSLQSDLSFVVKLRYSLYCKLIQIQMNQNRGLYLCFE